MVILKLQKFSVSKNLILIRLMEERSELLEINLIEPNGIGFSETSFVYERAEF